MITENLFNTLVISWILIGIVVFGLLFKVTAPYGKFISNKWGAMVNNRVGWIVMESPPLLLFSVFYFLGSKSFETVPLIIYSLWMLHYFNRDLIFPFRLKTKGKKMPAVIMSFAIIFNGFNAFFNGIYLGTFSDYSISWLTDFRFIGGLLLFITGFVINNYSDNVLFKLRKQSNEYQIPTGGMYKYISSPNYFGEMLEWIGFAILAWNLAAVSFCVWTIVNLFPRAIANHKWYQEHFENYPPERKAIIPFIM